MFFLLFFLSCVIRWRQKNAEENSSDSRKVWRIKQHLKLNKLEWNVSAAIVSAGDTKIFWPLQECFVRLSTLGSSNGPVEALMLDRYFTICTEHECNKVCGPPGRRGRDTSETSLGRDVQRPVQPRPQLPVLSEPLAASRCEPPSTSRELSWKSERTQRIKRPEMKENTERLWSQLRSAGVLQGRAGGGTISLQGPDQTGPGDQATSETGCKLQDQFDLNHESQRLYL